MDVARRNAVESVGHCTPEIARAIQLAESLSRPAFLRLHKPLEQLSFFKILRYTLSAKKRYLAWADGRDDRSFITLGEITQAELTGDIRFARGEYVSSQWSQQWVEASFVPSEEQRWKPPMAVGGFAFAARKNPHSGIWNDWPDGSLWIPQFVFHRWRSQRYAALTIKVLPGETPDDVRTHLDSTHNALNSVIQKSRELEGASGNGCKLSDETSVAEMESQKNHWCTLVKDAKREIETKSIQKVVLCRIDETNLSENESFDQVETLDSLRKSYPKCKVFMVGRSDGSTFLGATPELFLSKRGKELKTVALAGTIRRGIDKAEDDLLATTLLGNKKDRHEHQVVADSIEEALAPLSLMFSKASEPSILPLKNVQHLETKIQATLHRARSLMELLARLHPTPAVGGAPKQDALRFIESNESADRGWYAGLVGWIDGAGDGVFGVGIRSALIRGNRAWAFAGAGIVAESDPELEWNETAMKLLAVKSNLKVRDD